MQSGATFDRTGKYRFVLWRQWHDELPRVAFLMLNPATADATANDATIKTCIALSTQLGFGSLDVVNLFAYRTPDPLKLRKVRNPVGKDNDQHILTVCKRAKTIIAAWGNHGTHAQRADQVIAMLNQHCSGKLWCFGITKQGHPRHPLYIKHTSQIVPYAIGQAWTQGEPELQLR